MNGKTDFEALFKQFQDCEKYNGKFSLDYFSFQYKELLKREEEEFSKIITVENFALFLNLPIFIAHKIHKIFFQTKNKNESVGDLFKKGMQDLYFGSFEDLCRISFEIFDLSDSEQISSKDVLIILKNIILPCKTKGNLELLVNNFFGEKLTLNYFNYVEKIMSENSDIFILLFLCLYQSQPFSKNSMDQFSTIYDQPYLTNKFFFQNSNSQNFDALFLQNLKLSNNPEQDNITSGYFIFSPSIEFTLSYKKEDKKETNLCLQESEVIDLAEYVDLNKIWEKLNLNKENYSNKSKALSTLEETKITANCKKSVFTIDSAFNKFWEIYTLYIIDFNNKTKKCYQACLIDHTLFIYKKTGKGDPPKVKDIIHLPSLFAETEENLKWGEDIYSPLILSNKYIYTSCERVFYFTNVIKRNKLFDSLCEIMNIRKVNYDFFIVKEIGFCRHGEVCLAENVFTAQKVAIKSIEKIKYNKNEKKFLISELDITKFLINYTHENVVRCLDIYETRKVIYIIMEYCEIGDLNYFNKKNTTEEEQISIAQGIAKGIQFLHNNGIIHRDLKTSNVLLKEKDKKLIVKISDFGFSKFNGENQLVEEPCGSLVYAAPEIVFNKYYSRAVDIWSYGVILFVLFYGEYPIVIKGFTKEQIKEKFYNQDLILPTDKKIDPLYELLITSCLNKCSNGRFNIQNIINSKLFLRNY